MSKLTLDETIKLVETPLKEPASYIGEISLTVKVDSKMKFEKLQSMLDETGLKIEDLILKSADGSDLPTEVLGVMTTEWQEW